MTRSDEERVADILDAREIADLVADGKRAWDTDRTRRLDVERLLEIIGKSARAMSDEGRRRYSSVEWTDVVGLRTVLAHHDHRVDPNQVWAIASGELPRLVEQLED